VNDSKHWLYRPQNWPRLWKWGGVVLAITVGAEFFVDVHSGFGFANWFAFNAIFGFLSCLLMVLVAKWLGTRVKRGEDYYVDDPIAPVPGPVTIVRGDAVTASDPDQGRDQP